MSETANLSNSPDVMAWAQKTVGKWDFATGKNGTSILDECIQFLKEKFAKKNVFKDAVHQNGTLLNILLGKISPFLNMNMYTANDYRRTMAPTYKPHSGQYQDLPSTTSAYQHRRHGVFGYNISSSFNSILNRFLSQRNNRDNHQKAQSRQSFSTYKPVQESVSPRIEINHQYNTNSYSWSPSMNNMNEGRAPEAQNQPTNMWPQYPQYPSYPQNVNPNQYNLPGQYISPQYMNNFGQGYNIGQYGQGHNMGHFGQGYNMGQSGQGYNMGQNQNSFDQNQYLATDQSSLGQNQYYNQHHYNYVGHG